MNFKSFYRIEGALFDSKHPVFKSRQYEQLSKRLYYLLDIGGIGAVFGDPGVGKTYSVDKILGELPRNNYKIIKCSINKDTGAMLLANLALDFGLQNTFWASITSTQISIKVQEDYKKGIKYVLVLDNVDKMLRECWDDLINLYEKIKASKATIILIGQLEFSTTLKHSTMVELKSRVMIDYYMHALDLDQTKEYINQRLKEVMVSADVIDDSAKNAIMQITNGNYREINKLIGKLFLIGESMNRKIIDAEVVMLAKTDGE